MDTETLKTGVLGLDRRGTTLLQAIDTVDYFKIGAVADRDGKRAEHVAARLRCDPFDDYRQFIVQHDFDCLIVAAPLHSCLEHVRLALKKKIHVLKLPPMARGFEEALSLVELADSQAVRYDVATAWRYSLSYPAWQLALQTHPLEKPFLVRASSEVGMLDPAADTEGPIHPDHELAWVTDETLAGGGVLRHNSYELIDQLVGAFGLPQQVYALCSSRASDKQQHHHLTEDTALVTLRFSENLTAEVIATRYWDARNDTHAISLYGWDGRVHVDAEQLSILDSQGRRLEQTLFEHDAVVQMKHLLVAYAESLLKERAFRSNHDSNQAVMAVIDAAYLSARTGSPERPSRILEMVR